MYSYRLLLLSILGISSCLGQTWSLGGAAGFGFYHDATITNGSGSVQAGFGPRLSLSAVLGQNMGDYFGGEMRYTFRDGDAELKSGGQEVNMDAEAHAVHYDVLFYATPRNRKLRPYAAAGGGIKYYKATGAEYLAQPLSNFAFLTHANEVEGLLSAGGGLKYSINEHWLVRVDFRYYATPFPDKLFMPAPGAKINGWLHDFVPLAGIDWTFGK
ncbi:MAG TPA: outer membrane beta-barrel protein [Bryobacteraceae bacterium]|nr:outer membrane beta-barrel protein [Bryobacteraceae bacterium]